MRFLFKVFHLWCHSTYIYIYQKKKFDVPSCCLSPQTLLFCCVFCHNFAVFIAWFSLPDFSILVLCWLDLVVETLATGDRFFSSFLLRISLALILHRHPLDCHRFNCLLVGSMLFGFKLLTALCITS
jgi:uncharacterized membrane protein